MSTTTPAVPPTAPAAAEERNGGDGAGGRFGFVESILDNLAAWAVVAAAIAFLYLVWATLEILSRYVGILPKVTP